MFYKTIILKIDKFQRFKITHKLSKSVPISNTNALIKFYDARKLKVGNLKYF